MIVTLTYSIGKLRSDTLYTNSQLYEEIQEFTIIIKVTDIVIFVISSATHFNLDSNTSQSYKFFWFRYIFLRLYSIKCLIRPTIPNSTVLTRGTYISVLVFHAILCWICHTALTIFRSQRCFKSTSISMALSQCRLSTTPYFTASQADLITGCMRRGRPLLPCFYQHRSDYSERRSGIV